MANDNEFTINGTAYILYFDKENTQITLDTTDSSYTENTYNYWDYKILNLIERQVCMQPSLMQ